MNEQPFQKVKKKSLPSPQSPMRYYSHIIILKVKADEEIQLSDQQCLLQGPFGY